MSMKLWDLDTMSEKMCLNGHTEQIFDFAWSPCGIFGATVCKDGKIRVSIYKIFLKPSKRTK